jgi:hypothetical protein
VLRVINKEQIKNLQALGGTNNALEKLERWQKEWFNLFDLLLC